MGSVRQLGWLLLAVATACSSATVAPAEPNPVRLRLEQALAELDTAEPLPLRYNPAPCNCPAFELLTDGQWLRAELLHGDNESVAAWLAWLATLPVESLPVFVDVRGRAERDVLRTAQGGYAVRIDVIEVRLPLGPPSPEPVPATP